MEKSIGNKQDNVRNKAKLRKTEAEAGTHKQLDDIRIVLKVKIQ